MLKIVEIQNVEEQQSLLIINKEVYVKVDSQDILCYYQFYKDDDIMEFTTNSEIIKCSFNNIGYKLIEDNELNNAIHYYVELNSIMERLTKDNNQHNLITLGVTKLEALILFRELYDLRYGTFSSVTNVDEIDSDFEKILKQLNMAPELEYPDLYKIIPMMKIIIEKAKIKETLFEIVPGFDVTAHATLIMILQSVLTNQFAATNAVYIREYLRRDLSVAIDLVIEPIKNLDTDSHKYIMLCVMKSIIESKSICNIECSMNVKYYALSIIIDFIHLRISKDEKKDS